MSAIDMTKKASVVLQKVTESTPVGGRDVFPLAELYLGIDHSGSMTRYFDDRRRPVVHLAKQVLALGLARLDPDGKIPMWFFSSVVEGPTIVTQEGLYPQGRKMFKSAPEDDVVTKAAKRASWGSTNTSGVIQAITKAHEDTDKRIPGLAVIQTDGVPNDPAAVQRALVRASSLNLFFVFVGYGDAGQSFLDRLNDGGFPGQMVDNVYSFNAGDNPLDASDEWVFTEIIKEIPKWREAADGRVQGAV